MTPLQALEYLYEEASFGTLDNSKNTECLMLLTSLVTPPTVDEVVEEIKNELKGEVKYIQQEKRFVITYRDGDFIVCRIINKKICLNFCVSSNLFSLISRFYEGQVWQSSRGTIRRLKRIRKPIRRLRKGLMRGIKLKRGY